MQLAQIENKYVWTFAVIQTRSRPNRLRQIPGIGGHHLWKFICALGFLLVEERRHSLQCLSAYLRNKEVSNVVYETRMDHS